MAASQPIAPALISIAAAAEWLGGIHPQTVRRMLDRHELDEVRVGGRRRMVTIESLHRYIGQQVEGTVRHA